MASSSSTSSSRCWSYDVFLSFRGEDTRKNFVDHLYWALKRRLIRTYKDDQTLLQGDSIDPSLTKAIQESQISVIIFSKNYADSSWCLNELLCIMKCRDEKEQIVIPIFYDVDPSEVRKQKGDFGKAFSKQEVENITKAESWRKALVDASNIAGWELKHVANGHESIAINKIVDVIFERLNPLYSEVDEDLVGMRPRLQDLISRLEIGSNFVRMIGLWGVGGSGKTTLASSAYMEIAHHFEGHCIVDNIREESSKHCLKNLQEIVLSTVLKTQVGVQSVEVGKHIMRNRLSRSNILILLDDVDNLDQLEALAGSHKWFGNGSRIIITTRDEHLLIKHKVDQVIPVMLLSDDEAIQLFNRHAYNENQLLKDYERLSLHVVSYAAGLPLALKVLGSFLYDKNEKEWMSTFARLKDNPEMKVIEKLKISYDGLEPLEKELFLDIACFYRGKSKYDTMEILDACGFYPDIGIKVLIQKSLITVSKDEIFDMHDLVQEMGHYIVRGEHPSNPEKHSRVWKHNEISDMCFGDAKLMEYDKIEAIDSYVLSGFWKTLSIMTNLRSLKVSLRYDEYAKGPTFLSNKLRYINCINYPANTFPHTFLPMKLVVLKLDASLQNELWKGYTYLPQLKVLHLREAKNLLRTPDFGGLPCLEELTLQVCVKLEEIHPSLGNHRSLKSVHVSGCFNLRKFPTIVQMEKLETLEILNCDRIVEFPEIKANMESLVTLSLDGLGIQDFLLSYEELCPNLISLVLIDCVILKSIKVNSAGLKHLKTFNYYRFRKDLDVNKICISLSLVFPLLTCSLNKLDVGIRHFKDGDIPSDIGELFNLTELDLGGNDFSRLDFSLTKLTRLKVLNLTCCKSLVEMPDLPSSIAILIADECDSLIAIGDFHTKCKWLCEVSLMDGSIVNDGDRLLQSMLQGNAIENHSLLLVLKGLEIPKRFTPPLHDGKRCTLQLPENWCNDFSGFLMCIVMSKNSAVTDLWIKMEQVIGGMDSEDDMVWEESVDDEDTWVGYVSFGLLRHTKWWDETYTKLSFSLEIKAFLVELKRISGFGVKLVPRRSGSGQSEISTDENYDYTHKFEINHDSKYSLNLFTRW